MAVLGVPALPCVAYGSALFLLFACVGVARAEPKRVLLLHSYERGFEPFRTFCEVFRTELARQSPDVVDFFEVSVQGARFFEASQEKPFVDHRLALFAGRRADLVVAMGGPAVRFAQMHRARFFPRHPC
jgi:hypothetical protein